MAERTQPQPEPQPALGVPPPKERGVNKLKGKITDLYTSTVTFHPNKVHITRTRNNLRLKPGVNKITVTGFDPNIDQHSIKASADHRWIFFSHATVDTEALDTDGSEEFPEDSDLVVARLRHQELTDAYKSAELHVDSAKARMRTLGNYHKRISDAHIADFQECIATHDRFWNESIKERDAARAKMRELRDPIRFAERKVKELEVKYKKDKEQAEFSVGSTVHIYLYIDKLAVAGSQDADPLVSCNFTFSYANNAAFWVPKYVMSLKSTTGKGKLHVSGTFVNTTIETWKNCSVSFSTKVPTFRNVNGPDAAPPKLKPWRMKMVKMTDAEFEGPEWEKIYVNDQQRGGNPVMRKSIIAKNDVQSVEEMLYRDAEDGYLGHDERRRRENELNTNAKRNRVVTFDVPSSATNSFASQTSSSIAAEWRSLSQEFQEALMREDETVRYEAPGFHNIEPTGDLQPSRIHLGTVSLKDVSYHYYMTPKYDNRVFVKARIFNSSRLILAPGPVVVTLDEEFTYDTHIPRCAGQSHFKLLLGPYPRIAAKYFKPAVNQQSFKLRLGDDGKNWEVAKRLVLLQSYRPPPKKQKTGGGGGEENESPDRERGSICLQITDQIPSTDEKDAMIVPGFGKPEKGQVTVVRKGDKELTTLRWRGLVNNEVRNMEAQVRWKNDNEVCAFINVDDGDRVRIPLYYYVRTPAGHKLVTN